MRPLVIFAIIISLCAAVPSLPMEKPLVVYGSFCADDPKYSSIMSYFNGQWSSIGGGIPHDSNNTLQEVREIDGLGLVITGRLHFKPTVGNPHGHWVNNIAVWTGTAWNTLDGGVECKTSWSRQNTINDVAYHKPSGTLFVAGHLTHVGSARTPARWLAQWSSSQGWRPLNVQPGPFRFADAVCETGRQEPRDAADVHALHVEGNLLHIGGRFRTVGGSFGGAHGPDALPARNLAVWDISKQAFGPFVRNASVFEGSDYACYNRTLPFTQGQHCSLTSTKTFYCCNATEAGPSSRQMDKCVDAHGNTMARSFVAYRDRLLVSGTFRKWGIAEETGPFYHIHYPAPMQSALWTYSGGWSGLPEAPTRTGIPGSGTLFNPAVSPDRQRLWTFYFESPEQLLELDASTRTWRQHAGVYNAAQIWPEDNGDVWVSGMFKGEQHYHIKYLRAGSAEWADTPFRNPSVPGFWSLSTESSSFLRTKINYATGAPVPLPTPHPTQHPTQHPTPRPTPHPTHTHAQAHASLGWIAAPIVCGVAALAVVVLVIALAVRRRRRYSEYEKVEQKERLYQDPQITKGWDKESYA